jgi:cytoskeletal protein RodZ
MRAGMSRSFHFLVIALAICLIARRAPAPIVEPAENPTPVPTAAEEISKPTAKTKHKSSEAAQPTKSTESARPKPPQDRFAGTWSGKINQGIIGSVQFTLTWAPGGSQVTEHTSLGTYSHPATNNGQTATWKSGLLNEISWTFTPNSDGNSAHVTAKSAFGVNGDSTFQRGGIPAVVKPPSEFPTAKPVPERPGFVYNPFDPTSRIYIDVRGKASGTKLIDPKSGKTFLVP